MARLRTRLVFVLALGLSAAATLPAQALIVESGATAAIPVGVGSDPGWKSTTLSGSRNYVYLGDGWALTARHVGAPLPNESVQFFNGTSTVSLKIIPNQSYVVRNPASVLNSSSLPVNLSTPSGGLETDLRLIRLNGDPGLGAPTFTIAQQPLSLNDELTIIGHGRSKVLPQKHWNSSWVEVPQNQATYHGYSATDPSDDTKRWGKNNVANAADYNNSNAFYEILSSTTGVMRLATADGITRNAIMFGTKFDTPGAGIPAEESQATSGDSGSAVFHKRGAQWELAGIVNSMFTFANQPALTAVYGDVTTMTDLSYYYHSNPLQDYAFSMSDIIRTHANYSINGDVNLDGVLSGTGSGPVASDDVSAFLAGWGSNNGTGLGTINSWKLGDLSGPTGGRDGKTDVYDFLAVRNSINSPVALAALEQFYASVSGNDGTGVPEPSSALLCLAAVSLFASRLRLQRRAVR